jgi:hypothetical protein
MIEFQQKETPMTIKINLTNNTNYQIYNQGSNGVITNWSGTVDPNSTASLNFAAGPNGNYFSVSANGLSGSICGYTLTNGALSWVTGNCALTNVSSPSSPCTSGTCNITVYGI